MAVLQVDTEYLKQILEAMVRSVIQDEFLKLKLSLLPLVSDKEMDEINREAGVPEELEAEGFETLEL